MGCARRDGFWPAGRNRIQGSGMHFCCICPRGRVRAWLRTHPSRDWTRCLAGPLRMLAGSSVQPGTRSGSAPRTRVSAAPRGHLGSGSSARSPVLARRALASRCFRPPRCCGPSRRWHSGPRPAWSNPCPCHWHPAAAPGPCQPTRSISLVRRVIAASGPPAASGFGCDGVGASATVCAGGASAVRATGGEACGVGPAGLFAGLADLRGSPGLT